MFLDLLEVPLFWVFCFFGWMKHSSVYNYCNCNYRQICWSCYNSLKSKDGGCKWVLLYKHFQRISLIPTALSEALTAFWIDDGGEWWACGEFSRVYFAFFKLLMWHLLIGCCKTHLLRQNRPKLTLFLYYYYVCIITSHKKKKKKNLFIIKSSKS